MSLTLTSLYSKYPDKHIWALHTLHHQRQNRHWYTWLFEWQLRPNILKGVRFQFLTPNDTIWGSLTFLSLSWHYIFDGERTQDFCETLYSQEFYYSEIPRIYGLIWRFALQAHIYAAPRLSSEANIHCRNLAANNRRNNNFPNCNSPSLILIVQKEGTFPICVGNVATPEVAWFPTSEVEVPAAFSKKRPAQF